MVLRYEYFYYCDNSCKIDCDRQQLNQQAIQNFLDSDKIIKTFYLELEDIQACKLCKFADCPAYCLRDNHYYLLIEPIAPFCLVQMHKTYQSANRHIDYVFQEYAEKFSPTEFDASYIILNPPCFDDMHLYKEALEGFSCNGEV